MQRITEFFQQNKITSRLIKLHALMHEGHREMICENTTYASTYRVMHRLIKEKLILCVDL